MTILSPGPRAVRQPRPAPTVPYFGQRTPDEHGHPAPRDAYARPGQRQEQHSAAIVRPLSRHGCWRWCRECRADADAGSATHAQSSLVARTHADSLAGHGAQAAVSAGCSRPASGQVSLSACASGLRTCECAGGSKPAEERDREGVDEEVFQRLPTVRFKESRLVLASRQERADECPSQFLCPHRLQPAAELADAPHHLPPPAHSQSTLYKVVRRARSFSTPQVLAAAAQDSPVTASTSPGQRDAQPREREKIVDPPVVPRKSRLRLADGLAGAVHCEVPPCPLRPHGADSPGAGGQLDQPGLPPH